MYTSRKIKIRLSVQQLRTFGHQLQIFAGLMCIAIELKQEGCQPCHHHTSLSLDLDPYDLVALLNIPLQQLTAVRDGRCIMMH